MAIFRVAHFVEIRCCHMDSTYSAIHASDFRDFLLLKRKILFGIVNCGFEHPSEVQHGCIPQAIFRTDFLLKSELRHANVGCGFEHHSEVQHECILQTFWAGLGQAMASASPGRPQAGTSISAELELSNLGCKRRNLICCFLLDAGSF